jgi:hypothetical protein
MTDRKRDAADILTATVGIGGGLKARVGPVSPGIIMHANYAGLQGGNAFCGFDSYQGYHGHDGILFLLGGETGNRSGICLKRQKCHEAWYILYVASPVSWECNPPKYNLSYFTQIEAVAGLGGTVKIGFNPGELIDFLLGWIKIDIFKDDIEGRILSSDDEKWRRRYYEEERQKRLKEESNKSSEAKSKTGTPQ